MKYLTVAIIAILILCVSAASAQDIVVSKGISLSSTAENKTPVMKEVVTDIKAYPAVIETKAIVKGQEVIAEKGKTYSLIPVSSAISSKSVEDRAAYKAEYISRYSGAVGSHTVTIDDDVVSINIASIQYDASTSTVKMNLTASVNGVEKQIHNPYRIYNPPVLVQVSPNVLFANGSVKARGNFVEDPEGALIQTTASNVKGFPDGKPTFDGADPTLVVYATDAKNTGSHIAAFNETTATYFDLISNQQTIANMLATLQMGGQTFVGVQSDGYFGGGELNSSHREFMSFNTASLITAASVDNVSISYIGTFKADDFNINPSLAFTKFFSPNTTDYDVADYKSNWTAATRYTSDVSYSNFVEDNLTTVYFTPTGVSQVNTSGYTQIVARLNTDVDSINVPLIPAIADEVNASFFSFLDSNFTGTANDPQITVVYTLPPPPVAHISSNVTSVADGGYVAFYDESTGSPTAWNWSFENYLEFSTTQNPVKQINAPMHIPDDVGPFTETVILNASNAGGFDLSDPYIITIYAPGWYPGLQPPVASYTNNASFKKTNVGKYIQYNDTSTNSPIIQVWTVRNTSDNTVVGSPYTGVAPVIHFTQLGNFSVTLVATNSVGNSSYTEYMNVYGLGVPYADFYGQPVTGSPGVLVSFIDQSLQGTTTGLVYNWSFGDASYSLTPYSAIKGNVQHVYAYAGVYDVSLNVTNANGTSVMKREQYITVSTAQNYIWYSPRQTVFKIVDLNGKDLVGVLVDAYCDESTLPGGITGAKASLVNNYGMSSLGADQVIDQTIHQQGHTGSDASIVFTMMPSIRYNVTVTDPEGHQYSTTFFPIDTYYTIFTRSTSTPYPYQDNSTYSVIANSTLTFYEPNTSFITIGLDYLDISGRTSDIKFYTKIESNGTYMNWTNVSVSGPQHMLINKTYPNKRGQQWKWGYFATRVV